MGTLKEDEASIVASVGAALERHGWVRDRPRNSLGRFRMVYTRGEQQLALIAWYDGAVAVYEWSESLGWTRSFMGASDDVLRWVEREAR